jgi:hypothetical protein
MLQNLKSLNIQNNRFISIKEDVVDKLAGMKNLESLWINLSREEEVEIIVNVPGEGKKT